MTLGALSQSSMNSKAGPSRVSMAAVDTGDYYPPKGGMGGGGSTRMSMAPVMSSNRKSSLMPTNMPRKSTMSMMPR
jgi:hypothetical protein